MNSQPANPELERLIQRLAAARRYDLLREFACWCARQVGPGSPDNAWLIHTAERYTRGEISFAQMRAEDDSLPGSLSAACLIGVHKCGDPGAAVRLACGATHNPRACSAALASADWMRQYYLLAGRRWGAAEDEIRRRVQQAARLQVTVLRLLAFRRALPQGGQALN